MFDGKKIAGSQNESKDESEKDMPRGFMKKHKRGSKKHGKRMSKR